MARPIRELLREALAARPDLIPAELGRIVAAARVPPADPKVAEKSILAALAGQPRVPGGKPREIGEGLLGEILDALDLEIVLIPRGSKKRRAS